MYRITTMLILFCLNTIASATPILPNEIQGAVNETLKDCKKPKFDKGYVSRKDINGDGRVDYVLDHNYFSCDGSNTFCGSAGCLIQIFISDGSEKYITAYSDWAQDYRFTRIRNYPAIKLTLHGSYCGKAGADECRSILYWNGSQFSPAH